MRIICSSVDALPDNIPAGSRALTFLEASGIPNVGRIAVGWGRELERQGHAPSVAVWDAVLFCFGAFAADLAVLRKDSSDGWTRQIELDLTLNDPTPWIANRSLAERMLRVLTGDYWHINFLPGGPPPPEGQREICDRDCVSLLSGGLDSLIGGIDLVASGRHPIFVSQLAHEDSERQYRYAHELGGGDWHQQWSHKIVIDGPKETSTRGRSLAFYALAILSSDLLDIGRAEIIVPENGFISLNPPLLPGRMASLSTRTTHPLFMQQFQSLLDNVGVGVQFSMPYRFLTKGEMMRQCADQDSLSRWASDTTSCGRYRTYNRTHCGRCVPCMVRKAAFLHWEGEDHTRYVFNSLQSAGKAKADDPMALACAILTKEQKSVDAFLGATLAFASAGERGAYRQVVADGLLELANLLRRDGVL